MSTLKEKKVAVLATDGVEQSEIQEPINTLRQAGAEVQVLAPKGKDHIKAWRDGDWGESIKVDKSIDDAKDSDYDMAIYPGGVINADNLRREESAINFARGFFTEGKPIAAICHGAQTLLETGMLRDRRMTAYPAISTDLQNAGAIYENKELIVDKGFVTSRHPGDLPVFKKKIVEELAEGKHEAMKAAAR